MLDGSGAFSTGIPDGGGAFSTGIEDGGGEFSIGIQDGVEHSLLRRCRSRRS